jgi:hypothetical protein
MRNKTGIISGFIFGAIGFLMMFKVIALPRIPPEDELAPGVVVFISLLSGLLFAFIGSSIQNSFTKKRNYK